MGNLIYKDWARLLALTAGLYCFWAAIWGILFRKFFWDMVGGVLGPHGLIPPASSSIFIKITVDFPLLQIINLINGLMTMALEWPLPFLAGSVLHRSFVFRIAFYFYCSFFAIMVYQTVDSAIFYLITAWAYLRAMQLGERIEGGDQRGKGSMA